MKITCTGRKVNLKDVFEERVEKRLAKLDKFFSSEATANVTVTVEKDWQTVEVTIREHSFTYRAEKNADKMEEAFDAAVDLLERRIIKNRKRLQSRKSNHNFEAFEHFEPETQKEEEFNIIREKRFSCKPSSAEEAILNMEMLGHNFYLFRDASTDEVQVVYKRKDNSYGVLIPEK